MDWEKHGFYTVEHYAIKRGLAVNAAKQRFHAHDYDLIGHVLPMEPWEKGDCCYDIVAMKYMDRQIERYPMKDDEIINMTIYEKFFHRTNIQATDKIEALEAKNKALKAKIEQMHSILHSVLKENETLLTLIK